MLNKIIETCNKFNIALEHSSNPTDEEKDILEYLNLDLAKAIIQDIDGRNAKQVAKIILATVEWHTLTLFVFKLFIERRCVYVRYEGHIQN